MVFAPEGLGRFIGDRYHLVRELGRGGMGVVYLGRDLQRDMDVAIKFRGITHHAATLWLKREFRAVATLRHPNLVELYELVAHEASCYFTMEFLRGVDPRRYVEKAPANLDDVRPPSEHSTQSAVPVQDARTETPASLTGPGGPASARPVPDVDFAKVHAVVLQLAEGLAFLHANGVIHRDVKPSNAIVTSTGVKLLDFGLALERRRADTELEREARVVGTAAYLAPEYVEQLVVSPAMDVYALGVVAYELVTGNPPFGGTMHVLARLAKRAVMPRASSVNAAVPAELDEAIAAMLEGDPHKRPTALEIAERLTGELSQPRAIRRAPRFVGREREVAALTARIDDPEPAGRFVLVTGPSGVGKSALVDTVVGGIRRDDAAHLISWRGRCHERERVPYRAFDFVIDDVATELAYNPQLAAAIEHAGALSRVFPTLGAIAEAAGALQSPPVEDLRVERERARLALIDLFRHVSAMPRTTSSDVLGSRIVLVIDDLQWADDDSLELLALLVERIARPLTIVATWTTGTDLPDVPAALLERLAGAVERIDLAPMTTRSLEELIADLAPQASLAHLRDAAELAAGSPYLAELIGRELAADDSRGSQSNRSVSAERRRLDRLTAAERAIAELASLASGAATFEQLRTLASVPSLELHSALRGLEDERVVRRAPSPTGDSVFVFYHQRLRDAAAAAIEPVTRKAIHRRYAELFERDQSAPAQLAYHWSEAGEPTHAARAAITAAEAARAQLAWALAADWYARALDLGGDDPDLRARRADALFLGGKLAAAAAEFERLGGDRYLVRAGESYIKLGEIARGLELLDGVLVRRGAARAKALTSGRGLFARERARTASTARAIGVAARLLVPTSLRSRHKPTDEIVTQAYRVIASFLSTPFPIESFEYVVRGIDIAALAGDRAAHALGMAMLAAYLATGSLGRFGDRAIASAQRLAIESGEPYPRMVAAGVGGIVAMLRGSWSQMRDAHEEGWQICTRIGMERSWEASFLHMYWALGELYAGDPQRALAILNELGDASDDLISRALVGSYRGRALAMLGDLPKARALAAELARSPAARLGVAAIHRQVFAAELALAEHDWPRAAAIGAELARTARSQWLSALPAISAMVDVVRATAELGRAASEHDRGAAVRAGEHARGLYRRGRTSFYAATALRVWGQAEALQGNESRARAILDDARVAANARGGKIDQLALAALAGARIEPGVLASAVTWSTGGVVT
ncbi:MAG TPA: protein kinase [Kofleriaceae bacterium]|nr:protein kinase [Kofleriaceae bacterium]